jgi:uncharacterized membrane protein
MTDLQKKLNPSIPKAGLIFIAGSMWAGVGIMLMSLAGSWWMKYEGNSVVYLFTGLLSALFIHRYGFSKIVLKNLERIKELPQRACLFSFVSWKSYFIIIIMIVLGATLRHSAIKKEYLAILYTGIGGALFLSSLHYFKALKQN